jgi:acyl-CoA synthetase (AMP-forming)/AMP-acid ligase II
VRVPLNARYTALEVANLLDDCGVAAVFHDAATAAAAAGALAADTGTLWRCAVDHDDEADNGPGWRALCAAEPLDEDRSGADYDALASINYTSGSSGTPKGVMLSHRHWRSVARNMLIDRRIAPDDVLAHVGPLTHASGTYFVPFFLRGATSVIVDGGSIDGLLAAIARHRVTGFTCVPTVLTRLVRSEHLARTDLTSLRWIGCGADAVPQNTLDATVARLGPRLTVNYGLTEAMMTVAFLPPDELVGADRSVTASGCIGRPYTFVDVVLRDPDGSPVADGETGELTVRAEHVMAGYWRRPEATAEVLRGGWLWSGDLARLDARGLIQLVGRRKEMIISGGFNIYPLELERCITSHAAVQECAVVGVADADFGEVPVAFISTGGHGTLQEQDLIEHCKPLLGFRTPKRWTILDTLPRNPNGKVDKAALARSLVLEAAQ